MKIRTDLINEALYGKHSDGLKYHKFKLSKRFIEKMFRHYYISEYTQWFFDSEPDIDDELYDMSYEYKEISDPWNLPEYEGKNYTKEDFKAASEKVNQIYRDYEEERLQRNNWIEVFGEGIWSMTQQRVDEVAYCNLEDFRIHMPHKDRCYIAYDKERDSIIVYLYGRDIGKCDEWFIFQKRKRRIKLNKIKKYD